MIVALILMASGTEHLTAAEQEMQRQFAATMEVMESAEADAKANEPEARIDVARTLRAEQEAWQSFAQAKCHFEAEWYGPLDGHENVTARCLLEMVRQRIERLAALEQEYDDERQ